MTWATRRPSASVRSVCTAITVRPEWIGRVTAVTSPSRTARVNTVLEEIVVVPAGKRRLLRITVDGDGPTGRGPSLDDIAAATRAISSALDDSDVVGKSPYTLEVSSRGISRPLTAPRHCRRNRGRLVTVTLTDGSAVTGRVGASDDQVVELVVDGTGRPIPYA